MSFKNVVGFCCQCYLIPLQCVYYCCCFTWFFSSEFIHLHSKLSFSWIHAIFLSIHVLRTVRLVLGTSIPHSKDYTTRIFLSINHLFSCFMIFLLKNFLHNTTILMLFWNFSLYQFKQLKPSAVLDCFFQFSFMLYINLHIF